MIREQVEAAIVLSDYPHFKSLYSFLCFVCFSHFLFFLYMFLCIFNYCLISELNDFVFVFKLLILKYTVNYLRDSVHVNML